MSDVNANIGININASSALAELKALQRQIATFHQQVAKGSASAAIAQKGLQTNLLNAINATGKFHAQMGLVRTSTESFTHALESNKLSMGQYFKYAAGSTRTFGKLFRSEFDTIAKVAQERVKKMQTQYIKMGKDATGATRAMSITPHSLNMKDAATQTALASQKQAIFNQLVRQGSTNLLNFGKNTQWAGRQLMVGFSVPLLYIGSVAAKVFMDIEQQALKFKRVYGDMFTTSDQTNKALRDVELLAKEFTKYGVAVSKTMEMAASAAAMGKTGADLTAQVAQATRLAVLGNVEQEQALETTTSLTNAFGLAAEDLAAKIDFLNSVENQTVTSIEDLTIAIPKAGPVIKQLGGNVEDLAFFLTAMKEGGINASEGANALKSGLASLINPSKKAAGMFADLGINIKGIVEANQGDIKSTVIGFAQALDTLAPLDRSRAIEQLFGKFQFARLSTLFQNITKEGTQANKVLELSRMEVEELAILSERELKTVENAVGVNFKESIEKLKLTLVPIGEAFLKALTPVVKVVGNVLDKFNNLGEGTKKFIVVATGLVGFIGPVLLMTFGLLANGLANIIKLFLALRVGFLKMTKDSSSLGATTNYLTAEQLEATTVAASLNQAHTRLTQQFQLETGAVSALRSAYVAATVAAAKFAMANPGMMAVKKIPKKFAMGTSKVPGYAQGTDTVPAMLTPGEAVIPAGTAQDPQFKPIIQAMLDGTIQKYEHGTKKVTQAGKSKTMSSKDAYTHVGKAESIPADKYIEQTTGLSAYDKARINALDGITKASGKPGYVTDYRSLGFSFDSELNNQLAKNKGVAFDVFEKEWLSQGPEKWDATRDRKVIKNLHGSDNTLIDDSLLAKIREEAAKNNGKVTDDLIKRSFADLPAEIKSTKTYQAMNKAFQAKSEYGIGKGLSHNPKTLEAKFRKAVAAGTIADKPVVVIDGDALEYNGKPTPLDKNGKPRKLSSVIGNHPDFPFPKESHIIVERTNSRGKKVVGSSYAYDSSLRQAVFLARGASTKRNAIGLNADLGPSEEVKVTRKRLNKESLAEMKRIDADVKSSSMAKVKPTDFGKQIAKSEGYSFTGDRRIGGIYEKPDGTKVFVKPMVDEKSAKAELKINEIHRKIGLTTPKQVMRTMADPNNKRRRLIVLESAFNPKFAESNMTGKFSQTEYFKQLTASLMRGDKDLKRGNVSGNIVTDPGASGVFDKASGRRDYSANINSMLGQAEINLLGAPGGRGLSKDFAMSTLNIPKGMTADQYHRAMIAEIERITPIVKETLRSMPMTDSNEAKAYRDMYRRLVKGKYTDWRGIHKMHSAVQPAFVTKKESFIDEKTGKIEKVKGKKKPKGAKPSTGKLVDSKFTVIPEGKRVVKTPGRRVGRVIIPGYEKAPALGSTDINFSDKSATQSKIAEGTRVNARAIKATENLTKATDETTKASRLSKESLKSFGAKANLGVGALSALTVGASFAGGKIGEMATKIMPFVFGLQGILLLLPMLMNPLIGLPLAIGAVVAGIWLFNKKQNDAIKAEARLVDELYATTKKMQSVGEIFGKVGASQIMARKRETATGDFSFQRKGIKAGSAFLQSEVGKADLAAFETRFKAMPDIAMREFSLKLASYVSEGVIDAAQAASIADQIGIEFKDKVLGIKIQGQLQQLLTVNGKDLTKEPFEIRIKIAEETVSQFNNLMPNLQDQLAKAEQQKNAASAKLTIAKTNLAGHIITEEEFDAIEKEFRDAEKRVASIQNSIKQNSSFASGMASQAYEAIQAQIDGIDVTTSKSIDKLKAEKAATKNLEKQALIQKQIDNLESKRTASLKKLRAMNDRVTQGIEKQLELSDKQQFFTGSGEALRSRFKGTRQESDAELLLYKTAQMGQTVVRAKIEAVVSSGQFGPAQASGFINLFANDDANLKKTLDTYLNVQGIDDLNKLQSILGTFEDQDLAKDIMINMSGLSDSEFQAQYSTLELLMQMDNEEINVELVLKDPGALAKITKINTAIENIPDVTQKSVELALTKQGFPPGGIEEVSQNWEYFAGLPTDLRKTALQTFTTLHATIFANKESKMEWARNYAETITPRLRKRNHEEAVTRVLTTIIDVKTGEFTTKGNKAVAADVLDQTKDIIGLEKMIAALLKGKGGGGTGTRNTFLDNILDKIRRVRDASAKIVSEDPLKELRRLIAKGKGEITIFDGLDQQLSNLKAPQQFIDFIASLDPEGKKGAIDALATYLDTGKLENGIVDLTKNGELLLDIFREGVIGDFESDLKKSTNGLIAQKTEFIRLNQTVKDNVLSAEMLADAQFALAFSSAKTKEEINSLVAAFKAQKAAQDDLAKTQDPLAYLQKQFSVVEDKINKFFSLARQAVEGKYARKIFDQENLVEEAQDAVDEVNKAIQVEQDAVDAINLELKWDDEIGQRVLDDLQEDVSDMQRGMEEDFDRPIQLLSDESTILSNDLTLIDRAAGEINKKYDEQEEALSKISELNQDLIAQEKSRISLADALSQGDISAAAQIAQDMRSTAAAKAAFGAGEILSLAREQEIENLKSSSGQTRLEIEKRQFEISQQTYDLEKDRKLVQAEIQDIEDKIYDITERREVKLIDIRDLEEYMDSLRKVELKEATDLLKIRTDELDVIKKEKDDELEKLYQLELAWIEVQAGIAAAEAETIDLQNEILLAIEYAKQLAKIFAGIGKFNNLGTSGVSTSENENEYVTPESTAADAAAAAEFDKIVAELDAAIAAHEAAVQSGNMYAVRNAGVRLDAAQKAYDAFVGNSSSSADAATATAEAAQAAADAATATAEATQAAADAANAIAEAKPNASNIAAAIAADAAAEAAQAAADAATATAAAATATAEAAQAAVSASGGGGGGDNSFVIASSGGMVPKYMARGGMSIGSDTVPAMLTPGEFVMNKKATKAFGPMLAAINRSQYPSMLANKLGSKPQSLTNLSNLSAPTYQTSSTNISAPSNISNSTSVNNNSSSVYNYSVGINVGGSDASPQDIARAVMTQIKNVDSQRIRTQR